MGCTEDVRSVGQPEYANKSSENAPMKLASYQDGSRDGQLLVVSRDLSQAHYATQVANRLQQVLDDWNFLSPQLQDIYDALNAGRARHAFPFDAAQCMAPLPRAHQVLLAYAWPSRNALLRRAAGHRADHAADTGLLTMQQCAGDALLGAHDALPAVPEEFGLDFCAGVAVITGDIPAGCDAERALDGVRLLALGNGLGLRNLLNPDGSPTVQSQCATAFSPVAVTPDELGEAWHRGRIQLPLYSSLNGRKLGMADAGSAMGSHFGQLIAQVARVRRLQAGSVVLAAPVSQAGVEKKGVWNWPAGFHSLSEKRASEQLQGGQISTAWLRPGDVLRIEMKNASGHSVFGAIEQTVAGAQ